MLADRTLQSAAHAPPANARGRAVSYSAGAIVDGVQAEKLLPQPQDFTAFGLLNVKPRFSSPS